MDFPASRPWCEADGFDTLGPMNPNFTMESGSTIDQSVFKVTPDGSQDRKSPANRGCDAFGEGRVLSPKDVSCRVFGTDAAGTPSDEVAHKNSSVAAFRDKAEKGALVAASILPRLNRLGVPDARGTEHQVWYRGAEVEKHQHANGWMPIIKGGKICIAPGLPSEYLRRLELQNDLFGDDIKVLGLTPANRFAISQPRLKGEDPSENEIKQVLEAAGWQRVPMKLQDLPTTLMGSAWWHREEQVIMLDARKPNFKKTSEGAVLPIDLVLADLSAEMRELLEA